MVALIHPQGMLARLRDPASLRRGAIAGLAWGASFAAAQITLDAWQCGGVCLDEALWLVAVSALTGIAAIGPVAALARVRAP